MSMPFAAKATTVGCTPSTRLTGASPAGAVAGVADAAIALARASSGVAVVPLVAESVAADDVAAVALAGGVTIVVGPAVPVASGMLGVMVGSPLLPPQPASIAASTTKGRLVLESLYMFVRVG